MKWKRICEGIEDAMVIGGAICLTRGAFIVGRALGFAVMGVALIVIAFALHTARSGGERS